MPTRSHPRAARPSAPCAANIARRELGNGVRALAYENFASPAVVVSGFLVNGARDETPATAGLAGFTADCLARGTQRYSYAQLFELPESIGASLSVASGMHTCSFYAKSLAEDLPLMLDLLGEMLMRPTFPEDEVEKERAEWLAGLEERANSTQAMAGLAFNALCYPDSHPYHYSTDGYPETARAITRDQVAAFHRAHYSPQGMVVSVVGAVPAPRALDLAAGVFSDWQAARPPRPDMPPAPPIAGRPRRHVDMPGKSQTNLLWGFPGPARSDPDWIPLALLNSILGQFGMYGRLGESTRKEEGLVYYIGSRFEGGLGPGAWYVYAGTHASTVDRVIDLSLNEVRRIRSRKVTAAELADNQSYFIGSMPLLMETNEGIASQIVHMARYDLDWDYLLQYPSLVRAATPGHIKAAAEKWLDTDNFALATAGSPAEDRE